MPTCAVACGSLGMGYLLWQGPSSPKLTPAPMAAPVGRPQQALGLLFRRATPDAFQLAALFPSNPFLETTDPFAELSWATGGVGKQSNQAARGDRCRRQCWWLVGYVFGQFLTFDLFLRICCVACRRGTLSLTPQSTLYHGFISKPWLRLDCCTRRASSLCSRPA